MQCVIFDIDGTLADASHRIHHIRKQPKDWDSFFAEMSQDKLIRHIAELVYAWRDANNAPIVFVSGRPNRYRPVTVAWLEKNNLFNPFVHGHELHLFMRPDGDRRDDDIIKREILGKLWMEGYEPIMAFDDRDRIVKMWRANGIPCLQVAEGNF